jgi:acylphosphatase
MRSRFHGFVSGRVHGVAYRYFAQKWAVALSISGWVRNLADGRVEVLAEGDKEALESYAERLREGPRFARVEDLELLWEEPIGESGGFRIEF